MDGPGAPQPPISTLPAPGPYIVVEGTSYYVVLELKTRTDPLVNAPTVFAMTQKTYKGAFVDIGHRVWLEFSRVNTVRNDRSRSRVVDSFLLQ